MCWTDFYSGDKELMQLLFFDAKITHAIYNTTWTPTSKFEYATLKEYCLLVVSSFTSIF